MGLMFPKPVKDTDLEKFKQRLDKWQKKQTLAAKRRFDLLKTSPRMTYKAVKKRKMIVTSSKLKHSKKRFIPMNKLKKKADDVYAAWIRNRDKERGCYANEIPEERGKCKGFFCDCHLFGRGKSEIRYDEFNNNGGCSYHNQIHDHIMRPQPHIYTGWFIKKYGVEKYEELRKKSYIIHKWTREELEGIIEKYGHLDQP